MTVASEGQQPVVARKQGNSCGAKGHSHGSRMGAWRNAVCGESRLHGVTWGKRDSARCAQHT
ncbi:hypothetical protein [Brevibacillus formosus]|uniref:hypothetical protein n=1 Tax=Brevibacillus formosus TaxID=54913 RepID=UPI003F536F5F